jgi:hypothetical protein
MSHLSGGTLSRRFLISLASVAAIALCAFAGTASARAVGHNPIGRILGAVPSRELSNASASNDLIYNGGPVLDTNTAYAIFWAPSNYPMSSSYQSLIKRFFTDVAVATDAGASTNAYFADTQYGPTTVGSTTTTAGSLHNYSTFGGSYVDTTPIRNGCRDRYTSVCVTDSQVAAEVAGDLPKAGWSAGSGKIFFMFTPKGVGSCFSSGSCSFSQWCAYHSWSGDLLYANMPFADTVSRSCDAGYHPNKSIDPYADATINVTSHEHNESITDPFGSAWFNSAGAENGDLCAWTFGTVGGDQANQAINGDPYILQREWSNLSTGCVLQGT